jgi:hypothetical protein
MAKLAMVETDAPADVRRPRMVTALGKQTRGKTFLLKWYIERGASSRTRMVKVIDADPHNQTLARDFEGALTPGSTALEDRRVFLEQAIRDQRDAAKAGDAYDVVADVGGGDLLLSRLAHEIRFTETVDRSGIDLIAFYVLGTNVGDLEYFQTLTDAGFRPKHLALVFNAGLVSGDRSPDKAFDLMLRAPLVHELLARGAVPLFMPSLASDCVEAVERSGAKTFREALPRLGDLMHEMRLETWLDQAIEKQIGKPLADMGWLV